jgi:YegS/Rv2252/BmrU family lipid kinase
MTLAAIEDETAPAPPAAKRVLIVANPNSRSGGDGLDPAVNVLAGAGLAVRRRSANGPAALAALIAAEAPASDIVAVAGGDGTLNAAAKAVIAAGKPLGILPTGTANDLARTLGLPTDLAGAAAVIAAGHTRRIDLGEVNGHPFFNVASLGVSAKLAEALTGADKKRWGRLSYLVALTRTLVDARPFHASIVRDGAATRIRTLQIAVGNGRHYGGGLVVEENAAIDDGLLDLYSLEFDRGWKLLLLAGWFARGRHGLWREVRTARGTGFEIRTSRPRPINTDGELVTFTPARFRVLPGVVTVLVPPP